MAVTSFSATWLYPWAVRASNNSLGAVSQTLDASGERTIAVLRAPATGSITAVVIRSGATVTSSGDVTVRLESVDASTGDASGSLLAANTSGTVTVAATNTFYTATLTAAASVTKGDVIAVVVEWVSGNFLIAGTTSGQTASNFPYGETNVSGSMVKNATPPILALSYGGTYYEQTGTLPSFATNLTAIGTGTTPDELGSIFVAPAAFQVGSLWAYCDADGDLDVVLYNAANGTVASVSFDKDIRFSTSGGLMVAPLASPVTLTSGDTYRVVVKPTSATTLAPYSITVSAAAVLDTLPGGQTWHRTERTDAGSWTETTTQRVMTGIGVTGIDIASSAGVASLIGGSLLK